MVRVKAQSLVCYAAGKEVYIVKKIVLYNDNLMTWTQSILD